MKNKVVNYDGNDYDYSTYWQQRDYENRAEHILLNNFFKNIKGDWIIDVGGSFARITDTYYNKYKKSIIIDYSLKTLQKNRKEIEKKYPNTFLIAANAYKMPFKENSFDAGIMVRVLHHIQKQEDYFKEIKRILKNDSIYIQEFANKIHIKARIKAIIKKDKSINDTQPFQQPSIKPEGSLDSDVSFLNYHPSFVNSIMKKFNFKIVEKVGCSYLRIPLLKKLFGTKLLLFFEKPMQRLFKNTNISPSIFLKTILKKDYINTSQYINLEDLLACPACRESLVITNKKANCTKCNQNYFKKDGIWDFRVE